MKKRFVSLLLAISMILSLMPVSAVTAFAESENGGEVTTVDSGYCGADDGGENLRWTLDNNGVLTITGSGAMKDYPRYENQRPDWYLNHKDSIRSVVLDNKITHIGDYAFDGCTSIKSVRYTGYTGNAGVALPESVTTIGVHAFSDTGVTGTLKLPEHLTEIDSLAFYHCRKLNGELKLPDTVKEIGGFAFNRCGFTGKLELPVSLENIGNDAFESCSGLTGKLTFPSKMNEINFSIFHETGITEVVIPSSIKTVRDFAFDSCMNLKKVYLPTEIPKIYNRAFRGCDNVKFYYPAYKADWMTQTSKFLDSTLNADKDAVKPSEVNTWRPICYYVDVTFDAGSGKFRDGEQKHIVKGNENELYRTENLTEAMVTAIGTPKQSGYHFAGWSLSPNGSVTDVLPVADGYMTIADNGKNDFGGVEDGMTLYAVYTSAASVKINGFAAAGEEIKAGKEHEFTLIGDEKTDRGATVTLELNDSTNAKLEYHNSTTDEWQEVPNVLNVRDVRNMKFRVAVPKNADDATVTLTAVVKDASGNVIEDGGDSKTFKVNKYVNAEVTITDLDGTTVKAGEAKEFTVSVTPNDDTIDKVTFGTTSGEVQWSNDGGNTWTTVSGDVDYSDLTGKQFRVVPAADAANGTVTVTVIAKKADGTEAAKKDASFTVTKKEEPVIPGGGSTGGGENPGENPGGNPGSGSTKPEQETPKRKLEIADGTLTSVMVKDENGNLKDITDTITKDLDGKYEIPVGAKVTITAKDAPEGMKFGEWSISDKTLLGNPDVPYTEKDLIFTMPDNPDGVKLSVVYLEESIGEEPNLVEKGALAGTVVVGSAALLYQGHMLGTELYLRYLLPHGAVIPQNRAELAVLLWQDAESPEPVSTTLYSDISDEDSAIQQAARWAVENDLMEQLDADEHPDHFDPFVPVTFSDSIRAWKKAQELKKAFTDFSLALQSFPPRQGPPISGGCR